MMRSRVPIARGSSHVPSTVSSAVMSEKKVMSDGAWEARLRSTVTSGKAKDERGTRCDRGLFSVGNGGRIWLLGPGKRVRVRAAAPRGLPKRSRLFEILPPAGLSTRNVDSSEGGSLLA